MMNISNTFNAVKNTTLKRDMAAAGDVLQNGDWRAARDTTNPRKPGAVLSDNHQTYQVPGETKDGELGFGSKVQSQNQSYPMDGQNWQINMKNNKHNTLTVENNYGLKNSHYVVDTDKNQDKVELGGKGWQKSAANYKDSSTGKTGDLYKDGNGNEVLVAGGAKVDFMG